MPLVGTPPPQSTEQIQRGPINGQCGYITLDAWGNPSTSEWGAESKVVQNWAGWLHNTWGLWGSPSLGCTGQSQNWP